MVNCLHLEAKITQISSMRYTPIGLPVLDLDLEYQGIQMEAQQSREVYLKMKAIAFALVAERLIMATLDQLWSFTGFLSTGKRKQMVRFHILDFKPIKN